MGKKKNKKNERFSNFSELLGTINEDLEMNTTKKGKKSGSKPMHSVTELPFDSKKEKKDKKSDKHEQVFSKEGLIEEVDNIPDLKLRFEMMLQEGKIKNLREQILDSDNTENTKRLKDMLEKEAFRYELMCRKMDRVENNIAEDWKLQQEEIKKEQMIRAREEIRNLREKYGDEIIDSVIA